MSKVRVEKVQEFIKQEISQIILNEMKDPRIHFVTVTGVEATADLRQAKVFVSLYGKKKKKKETWQALEKAAGFLRSEIGRRIRLRCTPELSFQLDETLAYSEHIQRLLLQVQREDGEKHNG